MISVQIEGFDELKAMFNAYKTNTQRYFKEVVAKKMIDTWRAVADTESVGGHADPATTTGEYSRSITANVDIDMSVEGQEISVSAYPQVSYAKFLEQKNYNVPFSAIEQWADIKSSRYGKEYNAKRIWNSIKKHGTTPTPMSDYVGEKLESADWLEKIINLVIDNTLGG